METQDEVQREVQEVRVHAITLRRPRGKKRATAPPPPAAPTWTTRVSGGLRSSLSRALDPPHQGWLAVLGLSSLAVKGTGRAWTALVREGSEAQVELNRLIGDAAQRAGIPFLRQAKDTRPPGPTVR